MKKPGPDRYEPWLFLIILSMFLVPVLSVDYFVTGDGPVHLHNSKIIRDFRDPSLAEFYEPFYYLNPLFDPNRLYYVMTVPLIGWLGPIWTEKVWFTLYMLAFGFGFRYLISGIHPASKFISSVGVLFGMNRLVMHGYLNNAMSVALWFWIVGWWWRHRDDYRVKTLLKNAMLFLLLYFAHPIGLCIAFIMMGCLAIGLGIHEKMQMGWRQSLAGLQRRFLYTLISALPMLVLLLEFVLKSHFTRDSNDPSLGDALHEIIKSPSLVTMVSGEIFPAKATIALCLLLLLIVIFYRFRNRKFLPMDGLFLFFLAILGMIVIPPKALTGGLDFLSRMWFVPPLALLCWLALVEFPNEIKLGTQIITLGLAIIFVQIRFPVHREASDYTTEVLSVNSHIQDTSTVLVLNYDWGGRNLSGEPIVDKIWLLGHVDCYLGTTKSLIISDNYEAHFSYFPVHARWNTDMYLQTDKEGINFDHRPPRADILHYHGRTGQQLDYVLMLAYDEEFAIHPYTREIFDQLNTGYERIFTSAAGRAVLFKRKEG